MTKADSSTHLVALSLGSNVVGRHAIMSRAISRLEQLLDGMRVSAVYPTPAYKGKGPDYLNAVAIGMTSLDDASLVHELKELERAEGRTHSGIEVTLDIDLVVRDGEVLRPFDYEHDWFRRGYDELTRAALDQGAL